MDAWDREVVFRFLPAGMWFDGSRRPTGDLTLPEERDHEGLFGARTAASDQPDPTGGQRAV